MATTARLDLRIWRNDPVYEKKILVRGLDLRGVALTAQVRLGRDTPGAPLIDLAKVDGATEQGLRVAGVSFDTGMPVTDLRIRISQETRRALPYTGEAGSSTTLEWAMVIDTQTRVVGQVVILAHAYGSDAAPMNRASGGAVGQDQMPAATSAMTIAGDEVSVLTIDAAEYIIPYAARAEAAALAATQAVEPMQAAIRTGGGRGLYLLKTALSDPLTQFVGIVLMFNSIGWGQGASGAASIEPRSGKLTDARNNATSPSWANLFHGYLGRQYLDDEQVEAAPWPGSPSGVAEFTYRRTIDQYPSGGRFSLSNVGGVGAGWSTVANASALTGYFLQAEVASSSDNQRLAFRFSGYEFDLVFASLAEGARYDLIVNGEVQGTFSTQSADLGVGDGFGRVRTHTFGALMKDALVELRVVAGDPARTLLRLEAVRINKVLRVTNQSINGADAVGYHLNIMSDAVRAGDQFVLTGFGSNDRLLTPGSYASPTGTQAAYYEHLAGIVAAQQQAGRAVILCSDPAARNESSPVYKFRMSDARGVVASVADRYGCDMVDHFAPTRAMLDAGDTDWLADSVHLNDRGNREYFWRLRDALELSTH